ncbi:type II CAAX endopeptidase family protein [Actinocorallia longicatena]|uniref:CAAX prenyl protease 2/Lysostaphin resistance protein A-like domain-containing protein n=1 Tax=Actinocorallia longicatena TaxID=111803 RepID=A0ABP6QK67_9ACTN
MEHDASAPDPAGPPSWTPPDGVGPTFLPPEDVPRWPRLPEDTALRPPAPEWPSGGPVPGGPRQPVPAAGQPYPAQPYPAQPYPAQPYPAPGAPRPAVAAPPHGPGVPRAGGPAYELPSPYPGWTWDGARWVAVPRQPWAVPVEPGVPFLRMGRNAVFRWWRPVVGFLALAAAVLGTMLVLLIAGGIAHWTITGDEAPLEDGMFGNVTEDLAFQLAGLALVLPWVLLVTWGVGRRAAGSVISVVGRMRWRWLAACCGLGVAFVAVSYALSAGVSVVFEADDEAAEFVGWAEFWKPALVIVLLVPFQSAAEEFVFRGWLLQAVGSYKALRGPLPAMVLTSVLFVLGHGYTGWAMLDIFVFAMVAAWLVIRTGGLEASIALHVLNNLLAFLLPAAAGTLSLEQGGAPWYALLTTVPPLILYALAVLLLARRMRVGTVTPGGPETTETRTDAVRVSTEGVA